MPSREITVLSVSDRVQNQLFEQKSTANLKDIDLILGCGDLPYYYIEKLIQTYQVPTLFVRGNHDHAIEYQKNGPQSGPLGAIDLHKQVIFHNGLIFLGFEGSLRYRDGPFMYTQNEMWGNVISIVPKLLLNKLTYGRYLDVVVTHSPPWDINDQDTHIHRGFKAIRWLIKTFKPAYLYHGHVHIYTEDQPRETYFGNTKVINTFGERKSVIRAGKKHYPPVEKKNFSRNFLRNPAEDFRHARRKAALEKFWSTLSGKSDHLLQFQDIEDQLNYDHIENLGQIEIPLDAIVASANRQNDFTRKFFPRGGVDPHRWQRVSKAVDKQLLPINVYQVGEVYVVIDGNHRVSIARQRGETHIMANVTKIETVVSLSPDDSYQDLVIKNQLAQFLNDTQLNMLRPELDFTVTSPGLYRQLREQISIHHIKLELEHHYPYTYQEAVLDWVDEVYLPIIQSINQHGLLRDFPDHTLTDLFIWLINYQQELSRYYGWEVHSHGAIEELARTQGKRYQRRLQRLKKRIFPRTRLDLPPIGNWRETHLVPRKDGEIFCSILVAINGKDTGWKALEQAKVIAQFDQSTINGLHVIQKEYDPSDANNRKLQSEFRKRVKSEDLKAHFVFEKGEVVPLLNERAMWNDLLIFSLEHPPEDKPVARLRSNLRTLIQTCPRPLLAVPSPSPMQNALLAYDGSPKSNEALFLGAYLVEKWNIQLTVITALEDSITKFSPLKLAGEYLESRAIKASLIERVGKPSSVILDTMAKQGCDFIIAGGYGHRPVMEVLLGSTLDVLLRTSKKPIFICH